jgi:hypothetical protein
MFFASHGCSLKEFRVRMPHDDPRLGRLRDPCFFRPVGLARNAALRSPLGEALRAKCRATPTTGAARWQPAWRLASAPSDAGLHATDGLPAASTSVSLPKSAHVGTPCGPVHREPAVALARRFPASATRARRTRCSYCRTVPRIPTLCSVIYTRLHDPASGEARGWIDRACTLWVSSSPFRSRFLPLNHESFERRLPVVRIRTDHDPLHAARVLRALRV